MQQGLCNSTVSVRLSVPSIDCSMPGLLLRAQWAGDIDRLRRSLVTAAARRLAANVRNVVFIVGMRVSFNLLKV